MNEARTQSFWKSKHCTVWHRSPRIIFLWISFFPRGGRKSFARHRAEMRGPCALVSSESVMRVYSNRGIDRFLPATTMFTTSVSRPQADTFNSVYFVVVYSFGFSICKVTIWWRESESLGKSVIYESSLSCHTRWTYWSVRAFLHIR